MVVEMVDNFSSIVLQMMLMDICQHFSFTYKHVI